MTLRSIGLFVVAAVLEIGGAWLIWQAVREHRAWWLAGLGVVALGLYGFVSALQPEAAFGSLVWGVVLDCYRPDRFDVLGALVCLVGVDVIIYAPR